MSSLLFAVVRAVNVPATVPVLNTNAVTDKASVLGQSTEFVKYLGAHVTSLDACITLGISWINTTAPLQRCETVAWLRSSANKTLQGSCFCHVDLKWMPQHDINYDSARLLWPCRSDRDCTFNGHCQPSGTGTRCACTKPWNGPHCGSLDLAPVDRAVLGYRGKNATDGSNVSTWGAAMLSDSAGTWHGWASEMTNGCGIHSWQSNSQIIHLTAQSPYGPYTRRGVVWPTFAHEPDVVRGPAGEWVMTFSAFDMNGTGACTNCTAGTTSPDTPWIGCGSKHSFKQMLAIASNPQGPWQAFEIPQLTTAWDWNTALTILPNRSAVALIRGGMTWFAKDFANASSWVPVGGHKGQPLPDCGDTEDPYVWQDLNGRYHAVLHNMSPRDPAFCGIHAFSEDGAQWACGGLAYSNNVSFTDGTSEVFPRRERPHLLFDGEGTIIALSNGVEYPGHYGDGIFTLVQPTVT